MAVTEPAPDEPRAMFEQVDRAPRLSDKVADLLLETILSKRLKSGDRLPSERELGEQFGVSRTVVREAVRALAGKGILEVRSGSGLRVAAVGATTVLESMALYLRASEIDFDKVHEVRSLLEVHLAGLAAERATTDDFARLAEAHDLMASEVNVDAAAHHDLEFHRRIAAATHNELFLILLDSIRSALIEIRRSNLSTGSSPATLTQHRAILAAIEKGDAKAASSAMAAHLKAVADWWHEHAAGSDPA
jgi:GntR family transcriptional regulator, transcriptional repressor for pyruvate dehydrogenase complex